jgi:hypothetical protein
MVPLWLFLTFIGAMLLGAVAVGVLAGWDVRRRGGVIGSGETMVIQVPRLVPLLGISFIGVAAVFFIVLLFSMPSP